MITRNVKFQPGKLMIWLVLLVSLFFFDVLLLQAQVYPGTNFRFDRLTHEDGLSCGSAPATGLIVMMAISLSSTATISMNCPVWARDTSMPYLKIAAKICGSVPKMA